MNEPTASKPSARPDRQPDSDAGRSFRALVGVPMEQGLLFHRSATRLFASGLSAQNDVQRQGIEQTTRTVEAYFEAIESFFMASRTGEDDAGIGSTEDTNTTRLRNRQEYAERRESPTGLPTRTAPVEETDVRRSNPRRPPLDGPRTETGTTNQQAPTAGPRRRPDVVEDTPPRGTITQEQAARGTRQAVMVSPRGPKQRNLVGQRSTPDGDERQDHGSERDANRTERQRPLH